MRKLLRRARAAVSRSSKKHDTGMEERLRKVNEQVYKRNAELAVKNKTLTLLHNLSAIATKTFEPEQLLEKLTREIAEALHFPFVGVLLFHKGKKQVTLTAAHTYDAQKEVAESMRTHLNKASHNFLIAKFHKDVRSVFSSFRRKQVKHLLHMLTPFLPKKTAQHIVDDFGIQTTLMLPMKVNKKPLGFLVLSLSTPYASLSEFEKESIDNMINLINLALYKSFIYRDLKEANIQLKELDRTKTEFLSIASHQLRTPLSIIKGYVELIEDGAYGPVTKEMKKTLDDIDLSNERLVGLVDEFLDISRIEQGRTKFSFAKGCIQDVIDSVVAEISEKAKQKGLMLSWNREGACDELVMDSEKVRHVVINFIDNAVKYTPEGSIVVTLEAAADQVTVKVVDTGLGFEKEDQANFFQKFYRGKNVEGKNVNGTGLGIFVCKKFIEAHGGEVWAKSSGLGEGSEFGFSIPKNIKPAVTTMKNDVQ